MLPDPPSATVVDYGGRTVAVTPPPSGPSQAAGVSAGALLGARYRLDDLLASGGMAQVWLGTDEVLRRAIAVKILHQHLAADETFVTRFRHEAIAVARLSHPAIVNVYDTCSDDGIEAIVMELVRGQTLRQRLDDGPIDPWVAANIAAQVAGALSVAHAAGLVHRDIKPANILLSEDGRVKVGDFGIAKAAESADLTQEGSFLGTAKYLAPEQVEAKPVDGRTDLYSLGIVLYEMLCGRVPFEADSSSGTALARLHSDPQRPRLVKANVPRELEAITMRLLARDPAGRYPTATDARAALLGAGADDRAGAADNTTVEPSAAAAMPPPAPGASPSGGWGTPPAGTPATRFADSERRWLVPTLLVVLVAVALGVGGLLLEGSGDGLFGEEGPGDTVAETPEAPTGDVVPIVGSIDFDPAGGDGEHPEEAEAGYVFDGNETTSWSSETYSSPEWGGLDKPGIGIILELGESSTIHALEFDTPLSGWTAEVYVSDQTHRAMPGWGDPVAEFDTSDSGTNRVEFDAEGSHVLLWFTRAADGGLVSVDEVRVLR
ncbi:MAG: protein kinase [Acidimicrobiales bacterium]|nr:protein kinase [Acidimicrobiales bacterium]